MEALARPTPIESMLPKQLADAMAEIAHDAAFLWERMRCPLGPATDHAHPAPERSKWLDRWCECVGNGHESELVRRLGWDNLEKDAVFRHMSAARPSSDVPISAWLERLSRIIECGTRFDHHAATNLPINPDRPMPFEDVLVPAVWVARHELAARWPGKDIAGSLGGTEGFLSERAARCLEQDLLGQLVQLALPVLSLEFDRQRGFGATLVATIVDPSTADSAPSRQAYDAFVAGIRRDGGLTLFRAYPVLGRLLATAVGFWVEHVDEFLRRLRADMPELEQRLSPNGRIGRVDSVAASLSDRHRGGRTVMSLTFTSGIGVIYKPKSLSLEVGFNNFLRWTNTLLPDGLALAAGHVIERPGYGWVKQIRHEPCPDRAAVTRFFQRCGILACILHALRATDCHCENLIACGDQLLLVDMETLFHPEAAALDPADCDLVEMSSGAERLLDSVNRTGLLPRWLVSSDQRTASDISGLGGATGRSTTSSLVWQHINTDSMHRRREVTTSPTDANVAFLEDVAQLASEHTHDICDGFERMYRILLHSRERLLQPDSPLADFRHQTTRFIFRGTDVYARLLRKSCLPATLRSGLHFSVEVEVLSRAFLVSAEKPAAWPVLRAEQRALEQLDIPFFTADTDSTDLALAGDERISNFFVQAGLTDAVSRLRTLDEQDLSNQLAIIRNSLLASGGRLGETAGVTPKPLIGTACPTAVDWLKEARAIGTALNEQAIVDARGDAGWLGIRQVAESGHLQFELLDDSLYEGRAGIALFLAALHRCTGDKAARALALASLASLRRRTRGLSLIASDGFARRAGIGGASGLGALVYACVKSSEFLNEAELLEDAQRMARWITPQIIARDRRLDVIGGSAGALLGLLSLHRLRPEPDLFERALACGRHLLDHRTSWQSDARAWPTAPGQGPLAGFSHGAAGIAYALDRLFLASGDPAFRDAAAEGIAWEREQFSEQHGNWPDLREVATGGKPAFLTQWCNGACGIGLGRLGCAGLLDALARDRDVDAAVKAVARDELSSLDHLCCGEFGRVEFLLVASQRSRRSELAERAARLASAAMARAQRTGGFRLFSNLPRSLPTPGLFQGIAGIGYQMLRLSDPRLPCLLLWE